MIALEKLCNGIIEIAKDCEINKEQCLAIEKLLALIMFYHKHEMYLAGFGLNTTMTEQIKPIKVRRKRRTKEEINAEKSRNNEIGQDISGQSE